MKTRTQCQALASRLASTRAGREARWRSLRQYICPWRGIFEGHVDDSPSHRQMLRFTQVASQSVLRGASGMTSGMTPRNISWFKPGFTDAAMMEASGARAWLDSIDKLMKDCLSAGGFYQAIQSFNTDLIWAGCALLFAEAGDETPLRYECPQVGTWHVALDSSGRLETVLRHVAMTAPDIARLFGKGSLTDRTRRMLETNPLETIRVWHLVCPAGEGGGPHPWASYWWEDGQGDSFLRVAGYYEMPFFFTSWHEGVTPYGTGPGDEALPDARQMDLLERRKLEGIAKIVSPPMQAPMELKGQLRLQAGDINYTRDRIQITPLVDLSSFAQALPHIREEIRICAQRLEQSLLASVFSSVSLEQRPPGMSATEFLERKRETLQRLGPVISAYEPNVLTPLLFRTIQAIDRAQLTTPPPQSLAGTDLLLRMEFISPMATAMRQTGAETTRALFQDVAGIVQATGDRSILDKLDLDQMVDELATGLGVPGSIIRADADVAAMRQARIQAEEQSRQMELQSQAMQALAGQAEQAGAQAAAGGNPNPDGWI